MNDSVDAVNYAALFGANIEPPVAMNSTPQSPGRNSLQAAG
jgi:hypothetical protein